MIKEPFFFSFAPFFAILYKTKKIAPSLWVAASCGLLVDTFSIGTFGVNTIMFTFVTLITHEKQKYFSDTSLGRLFFVFVISLQCSVITYTYENIDKLVAVTTSNTLLSDFLVSPILDALMGLILFYWPSKIYFFIKKIFFFFCFLYKGLKTKKYDNLT